MTDNKNKGVGSKILRDRAMAVLRDTRAKIDPQFLAAMKEKFSSFGPSSVGAAKPEPDEKTVYPKNRFADESPLPMDDKTEPVDKQKIAQIVLNYMKNRPDQSKH